MIDRHDPARPDDRALGRGGAPDEGIAACHAEDRVLASRSRISAVLETLARNAPGAVFIDLHQEAEDWRALRRPRNSWLIWWLSPPNRENPDAGNSAPAALTLSRLAILLAGSMGAAGARVALDMLASERPDFILILMDNFGYGEVGAYGGGDRRRGARAHPLQRRGAVHAKPVGDHDRALFDPLRRPFTADRGRRGADPGGSDDRRDAVGGLRYGAFGKWGLGSEDGRLPNDQGFDEGFDILRPTDEAF